MAASYAIPVRRSSVLPAASFRSHLTVNTLADQLTVPPAGAVGDLHPQVKTPCLAHNQKRSEEPALLSSPVRHIDLRYVHLLEGFVEGGEIGVENGL